MRIARLLRVSLFAAAATLAAAGASATTFVIDSAGIDGDIGYRAGRLYNPGLGGTRGYEDALIGRIKLSGHDAADPTTALAPLRTWCVDIFDWLGAGTFTTGNILSMYTQDKVTTLTRFLTNADALVVDGASSAAMQLGIWEILNETSGTYDVAYSAGSTTKGSFSVASIGWGDPADAIALANGWLGNLNGVGGARPVWDSAKAGKVMTMIDPGAGNQPQVYLLNAPAGITESVPEPATWLTMVLGFGGMGYAMRRRRRDGVIA